MTPYNEQPITVVLKSMKQKVFRQAHCWECGMPVAEITDKIVTVFDGVTPIEQLRADTFGVVEFHCKRHACKQYYRMEFAA